MRILYLLMLSFASIVSLNAYAFSPSIVYDLSGKHDKSFGEQAYQGVLRFEKETGIKVKEFELTHEAQRDQILRKFSEGSDFVVVIGMGFANGLVQVAKEYPKQRYMTVDNVVEGENIQSVLFKEEEGCFLVGALASIVSKSQKLGFIGGMDIPVIRRFSEGFEQGAHYINPKLHVTKQFVGSTPEVWSDPIRGFEMARGMIDRGVDIVFAAAGETGLGALQAAAESKVYSIGVDSNQNDLYPGSVLTSMVKRVDIAVYEALRDAQNNTFKGGIKYMGLKEGGVDYTIDEYNKHLIPEAYNAKLQELRDKIIAGEIKVSVK